MTDREKKIAEIDDALYHVQFGIYPITAYAGIEEWLRFLRSELEQADKEQKLFDQRGETIERLLDEKERLQEENRKLQEENAELRSKLEGWVELEKSQQEIERIIEILKNGQPAHWQAFKIRQLLGVTME